VIISWCIVDIGAISMSHSGHRSYDHARFIKVFNFHPLSFFIPFFYLILSFFSKIVFDLLIRCYTFTNRDYSNIISIMFMRMFILDHVNSIFFYVWVRIIILFWEVLLSSKFYVQPHYNYLIILFQRFIS